jgi:hypothetical protein
MRLSPAPRAALEKALNENWMPGRACEHSVKCKVFLWFAERFDQDGRSTSRLYVPA